VIRFHLDENVHHGVARGLRLRGIDVTTTTDAGLVEATDEGQFQFAIREGRVFVTHDADFLRADFTVRPHAGIVFVAKGAHSIGEIVRSLDLLANIVTPEEMRRQTDYL
jgi:predicted nuclease of predicted toxin-antitoxin system